MRRRVWGFSGLVHVTQSVCKSVYFPRSGSAFAPSSLTACSSLGSRSSISSIVGAICVVVYRRLDNVMRNSWRGDHQSYIPVVIRKAAMFSEFCPGRVDYSMIGKGDEVRSTTIGCGILVELLERGRRQ